MLKFLLTISLVLLQSIVIQEAEKINVINLIDERSNIS